MKELILGGASSGKSRIAEQLANTSGLEVTYIATAHGGDEEMALRIQQHRSRRPGEWRIIEEPTHLLKVLAAQAAPTRCLLVDCLTLWLSNLYEQYDKLQITQIQQALVEALPQLPGRIIMVSNEISLGGVSDNALARAFCDTIGQLHQDIATGCNRVIFCVAGIPQVIKGTPLNES